MQLALALVLCFLFISLDARTQGPVVVRGEVANFAKPPAPPFAALRTQVDALREEVDGLAARSSGLRVFDGDGNDVGLYAGREGSLTTPDVIRVFLEDLGGTATYDAAGRLLPLDRTRLAYASDDCQGQAFYDVAGIVGASPPRAPGVLVTGTETEQVPVASRIVSLGPRGEPICRAFPTPSVRPLVPVESFDPAAIGVAIQLPPLLFVAPAE